MTIDTFTITLPASGRFDFPGNNYFLLFTATLPVDVRFIGDKGDLEGFTQVTANCLMKRIDPWRFGFITGAAGTVIVLAMGTEKVLEDQTDIRGTASSIAGTVATAEVPLTVAVSPAQATVNNAAAATVAANASRRSVVVSVLNTSPGPVFVQSAGAGANCGVPVYGGQSYEVKTRDSFDIRNDSGAVVTYNLQEFT